MLAKLEELVGNDKITLANRKFKFILNFKITYNFFLNDQISDIILSKQLSMCSEQIKCNISLPSIKNNFLISPQFP